MNNHITELNFNRRSSKIVEAECELKCSPKCRIKWKLRYSRAIDSIDNHGKIICLYCSHTHNFSGRNNPNCKYKNLNDKFFQNIDTEEKAYLLGWIAGDGTVQPENHIEIIIHKKDLIILEKLRDIICPDLPIWTKDDDFVGFRICSAQITKDICNLLHIKPGKKYHDVSFPELASDVLGWHFIRGLFDADGCTAKESDKVTYPQCCIASISTPMKEAIRNFSGITGSITYNRIQWGSTSCLRFLTKMYENSSISLERKKDLYYKWMSWKPIRSVDYENSYFDEHR